MIILQAHTFGELESPATTVLVLCLLFLMVQVYSWCLPGRFPLFLCWHGRNSGAPVPGSGLQCYWRMLLLSASRPHSLYNFSSRWIIISCAISLTSNVWRRIIYTQRGNYHLQSGIFPVSCEVFCVISQMENPNWKTWKVAHLRLLWRYVAFDNRQKVMCQIINMSCYENKNLKTSI